MKRIFFITAMLLLSTAAKAAPQDELWNRGNELYAAGDYAGAIAAYDSIEAMGYRSAKLFYNLGNAHFKNNSTGRAILNYNRAQLLAPADTDTEHNLRVADTYVKDRIEVIPQLFFIRWINTFMNIANSNVWATLSLVFLASALVFTAVYLLAGRMSQRKLGFWLGMAFAALFIMSLSFASVQRSRIVNPSHAVVMSSAAPVKSSPDADSKDMFVLHEGTRVSVTNTLGQWREITIADGNRGWINSASIEMID